ncbi:hypothetical protein [Oceanobacillus kimchii]|uniref:hypothetical protein n=1 Tax=Oceanobacillus kimchii TaxID=746691 RepID=UPI00232B5131|nr:hypothetical protein [Oceanobacillus kimchii]
MDLKKIAEAVEVINNDREFISLTIDYTGPQLHVTDFIFDQIINDQEVFYEERSDLIYPYKKYFYIEDLKVFCLVEEKAEPSNPYGLTEQERDMRNAGHKESDFFE